MTVNKKIKIVNNKIEQTKAQYNLDRQTAKILALSSGNVGKYDFLTVLLEKELSEKATTVKRIEYSPLGSELKKQTDIVVKQYQGLKRMKI